jgi:arylsulfatase A-like enzyme
MFEGGTRAVSFVHGARWLNKSAYVHNKLMHITDWMPTLLSLGV